MSTLAEQLRSGKKIIGVWGTGYIGFSTMANFAANGVKCVGTDISQSTVDLINHGKVPVSNMDYWLGFDVRPLVGSSMIRATANWKELIRNEVGVHMVAVPTEKGDTPYDDALKDVIAKIAMIKDANVTDQPLVVIESTLTPNKTDELVVPILSSKGLNVGEDILVGVAPRRDWFISPEKNLKTLPRIIGGTTPETTEVMKDVLGIVCDNLLPAKDHRHAEIVKCVENAYRHVEITLANQLTLAYPDIDMVEVLRLVGTKWNIGTYHPSFGTGGYCIPLASKYVLQGTKRPELLSILGETISTDRQLPMAVAESLVRRGAKKVGILGLAYKGDLKVHVLSPTIKLVQQLRERGVAVKVNDPYYSPDEIKEIVGTDTFNFPEGLSEFDTILIVAGHRQYRSIPESTILDNLRNCKLVLDNIEEAWRKIDFRSRGIEYHVAGDKGWLGFI